MEDIQKKFGDVAEQVNNEAGHAAEQVNSEAGRVAEQAQEAAATAASDVSKQTEQAAAEAKSTFDSAADKVERTADRAAFNVEKFSDTTAPPDQILAGFDLGILLFCFFNILFFFLAPGKPYYFAWFMITLLLAAKSSYAVFCVSKKDVAAIPQRLPNCIDGAYLFCGFVLVFLRPNCLFLLVVATTLNTLIDLAHTQSSGVLDLVQRFRPDMKDKVKSMLEPLSSYLGSNVQRFASGLEIVNLFVIPFARSGFMLFPLYIIFLAMRYRTSAFTRKNFHYVDAQVTTLLQNKSIPPPALEKYKMAKTQASSIVMKK